MAPIDIVEAEAEVARNQQTVILAEAQLARGEGLLRTLVMDPAGPDFWVVLRQPTDTPLLGPRPIDVDEAIRTALERRIDIDQLRKRIENTDTNARLFANQRLPASTSSSTTRSPSSAAGGSSAGPAFRGRSSASRNNRSGTSSATSSETTFRPGKSD